MIALKQIQPLTGNAMQATYEVRHGTPGRSGTVLSQTLEMQIDGPRVDCRLVIEGCQGDTPEEALERMAGWCDRMAAAIRERPKSAVALPLA